MPAGFREERSDQPPSLAVEAGGAIERPNPREPRLIEARIAAESDIVSGAQAWSSPVWLIP